MAARNGKCSPMKQVASEKDPLLGDNLYSSLESTGVIPGQDETVITNEPGDLKGESMPNSKKAPDDEWLETCRKNPCLKPCHEQFGQCPEKEVTTTVKGKDKVVKKEDPIYKQTQGDADYNWQQRQRGRAGLYRGRMSGKKARKGYAGMTDEQRAATLGKSLEEYQKLGIKNKKQFGRAAKDYANAQESISFNKYAQTQREMGEQGVRQGSTGRGNISQKEEDRLNKVQRELKSETNRDTQITNIEKRRAQELEAKTNKEKNQNAVLTETAKIEADEKRKDQEDTAAKMMYEKPSVMKMKGSFKMKGFGSKR